MFATILWVVVAILVTTIIIPPLIRQCSKLLGKVAPKKEGDKKRSWSWSWKWVWVPFLVMITSPLWWGLICLALTLFFWTFPIFHVDPYMFGVWDSPAEKVRKAEQAKVAARVEAKMRSIAFSDEAKATSLTPSAIVEIPASKTEPTWAFAGVLPPGQYEVNLGVYPQGHAPDDEFFLVDGFRTGEPMYADNLQRMASPSPAPVTSVLPTKNVRFPQRLAGNGGETISALYVQSNTNERPKRVEVAVDVGQTVETWMVSVDREGVSFTIPPEGWEYVWVLAIADTSHQSSLINYSLPPAGLTEQELGQILVTPDLSPEDHMTVLEYVKTVHSNRPDKTAGYQALLMNLQDGKPNVLQTHKVWTPRELPEGGVVQLRLNAGKDELEKSHTPARVLVGWKKVMSISSFW